MFSLLFAWTSCWTNSHVGHCYVIAQTWLNQLTHKALNIADNLEKYRVSWCPSSLCRQVISKHGIDKVYFAFLRVSFRVHIKFQYIQDVLKFKNNVTYVNRIKWWLRASTNTPLNPLSPIASGIFIYISLKLFTWVVSNESLFSQTLCHGFLFGNDSSHTATFLKQNFICKLLMDHDLFIHTTKIDLSNRYSNM